MKTFLFGIRKQKSPSQSANVSDTLTLKPGQCNLTAYVAAIKRIPLQNRKENCRGVPLTAAALQPFWTRYVPTLGLGISKKIFPDDYSAILTCAYYLISEGQALSRAEKWSRQALTPYGAVLADQRISELLVRITPALAQDFFSAWIEYNRGDKYYCMDITSVSSYSELNEFVSYGYNRDREKLPQVNLLMVSGHTSHLPLFFRTMPGSIHDVSTMDESLKRLDQIGRAHV